MKTVLQKVIQWTNENAFTIEAQDGTKYIAIDHEEMSKKFDEWLQKEQEQIVLAHEQGRSDKHNDFGRDGETYYKEQYSSTCL